MMKPAKRRWIPALATLGCLVVGTSVFAADWAEIADLGNRKLYLWMPVPKYNGKPIRVWSRISFNSPQQTNGKAWQTWIHLQLFDCDKENVTDKNVTFYAGPLVTGQPVFELPQDETSAVQPGTMGATIFELVCKH